MAPRPFGMSANFKPAEGDKKPGSLLSLQGRRSLVRAQRSNLEIG